MTTAAKPEKKEVDFGNIEVLARMTDTKITTREICDKWLLITYDIPHTEAGDKARREFLIRAHVIGAARHTDSVYFMPWTPEAEVLALHLAKVGEVVVWSSQTTDPAKAGEITKNYDLELAPMLRKLSERINKIQEHFDLEHTVRAEKMMEKTKLQLDGLEQAVARRGNEALTAYMTVLRKRFENLG